MESKTRQQKGKGKSVKKPPRRKTGQKQTYVFVRSMIKTQEYKDYFNPNSEAEKRLLGLADLVCTGCVGKGVISPLMFQNPKRSSRGKDKEDRPTDVDM